MIKKTVIPVVIVLSVSSMIFFTVFFFKYHSKNGEDYIATTSSTTIKETYTIIAAVNGKEITRDDLNTYIQFLKYHNGDSIPPENDPRFETLKQEIIDFLIISEVLKNYCDENNISASAQEIDNELQKMIKKYPSEAEYHKDLDNFEIEESYLTQQIAARILRDKTFSIITGKVKISDDEIKQYYDDNYTELFKDQSYDDVRDSIMSYLLSSKQTKVWADFIDSLVKSSEIIYISENQESIAE